MKILQSWDFPGGPVVKNPPCNAGATDLIPDSGAKGLPRWPPPTNAGDIRDTGSIPGLGRSPRGGHGNPLQYSCLENPHGLRSLGGYSPWGRKESDTTEVT